MQPPPLAILSNAQICDDHNDEQMWVSSMASNGWNCFALQQVQTRMCMLRALTINQTTEAHRDATTSPSNMKFNFDSVYLSRLFNSCDICNRTIFSKSRFKRGQRDNNYLVNTGFLKLTSRAPFLGNRRNFRNHPLRKKKKKSDHCIQLM